jgi:hypothetical protein
MINAFCGLSSGRCIKDTETRKLFAIDCMAKSTHAVPSAPMWREYEHLSSRRRRSATAIGKEVEYSGVGPLADDPSAHEWMLASRAGLGPVELASASRRLRAWTDSFLIAAPRRLTSSSMVWARPCDGGRFQTSDRVSPRRRGSAVR